MSREAVTKGSALSGGGGASGAGSELQVCDPFRAAMASKTEMYRANAAECRAMAAKATSEGDKVAWLQLAKAWVQLLEGEERLQAAWFGLLAADRPSATHGHLAGAEDNR